MNIVTGCSGIDAIAYVAYLLDIELIGQIEIEPFCNRILELRFPGVKRYEDIFNVRGDEFGAVDIFAAGIPCQPFSHAGKREGTEDDRYLWPETIRIIRVMQPTWAIIENVDGIGSMEQSDSETVMETETEVCQDTEMVLETIRKDFEEAGYNSIPIILPACSVEAPHQRYRYFIVGYSGHEQPQERRESKEGCKGQACNEFASSDSLMGYSNNTRGRTSQHESDRIRQESDQGRNEQSQCGVIRPSEALGNTECGRCSREPRGRADTEPEDGYSRVEIMADTDSEHSQNCDTATFRGKQGIINGRVKETRADRSAQSGMGGNVDGLTGRLHRPGGQEDSGGILGAFEAIFTAALEQILWPAGYGAEQYDYEPPRVATGVKNRTNRLKALGNAIVPWQIMPILLAIKLIERCSYEYR